MFNKIQFYALHLSPLSFWSRFFFFFFKLKTPLLTTSRCIFIKNQLENFPVGPVVKTPPFQYKDAGGSDLIPG